MDDNSGALVPFILCLHFYLGLIYEISMFREVKRVQIDSDNIAIICHVNVVWLISEYCRWLFFLGNFLQLFVLQRHDADVVVVEGAVGLPR